jgi:threonine dehydratase
MSDADAVALVRELDAAVVPVGGTGFHVTPFGPDAGLCQRLGLDLWVKDETGNVAGSHKARHLVGVLLHLLAAERLGAAPVAARPRLAIASCGNAALAAATLARAVDWPLDVYVPHDADGRVLSKLENLGARLVTCRREASGPPGDPCIRTFRAACDAGAIPFTVQGPENALCLDTGRTIAWEMADAGAGIQAVMVQVGGGALATCVGDVLASETPLYAVQTEGCAPLARAWTEAQRFGVEHAAEHWTECMWPWEHTPSSAATGILDDETYDWLGVLDAMATSRGAPIVVPEALIVEAARLVARDSRIPADATGSAGLAGLLAMRDRFDAGARVGVLFTGRNRAVA